MTLYLRAHTMILSRKRQISEALGLLRQAIDRDPRYGPALAWAGICYFHLDMNGRKDDPEFDYRDGVDFAHRALEMAADDPDTLANAALALGYFGEDIDAMLAVADRALVLNPSFARGWHVSGLLRMWAGDVDRAIEHVQTSLQLSPRVRAGWAQSVMGGAHFFAGRFDQAAAELRLAVQEEPSFVPAYRLLAACYAQMGRLEEAKRVVQLIGERGGNLAPRSFPFRDPNHRQLLLSGLRLAAGDTTLLARADEVIE